MLTDWYQKVLDELGSGGYAACSTCRLPTCSCSGHASGISGRIALFPGEKEFIEERYDIDLPAKTWEIGNGIRCYLLDSQHRCSVGLPLECKFSPVFPMFRGVRRNTPQMNWKEFAGFTIWDDCTWVLNLEQKRVGAWITSRIRAWQIILRASQSDDELSDFLFSEYHEGAGY